MQLNFDINFVIGDKEDFLQIEELKPLKIFSEQAYEFLNALSKILIKEPSAKQFSDVITFAFWCRKASIKQMSLNYNNDSRFGRGISFHISPSNVAVNFAYSFVVGLLAGNINIVRLPSKNFLQVDIICNAIKKTLLEECSELKPYIYMIRYGHEREITDILSNLCDVRVIWGGDDTIRNIRKSPLKIRANEITFSDRYSIAIIHSEKYLNAENKQRIAIDFYNDTYLNDQNACTAPKLIIWLDNHCDDAREIFWQHLQEIVDDKYDLKPIQAVDKLVKIFLLATTTNVTLMKHKNNRLICTEVFDLHSLKDFEGNSGFFIEYKAKTLNEILPICSERCQTLSYYGIDYTELKDFIMSNRPKGIDRIVPLGKTLNFSLIWDGYDLIYSMSRKI